MQRCAGAAVARRCFKPSSWRPASPATPTTSPAAAAAAGVHPQAAAAPPRQLTRCMASTPASAADAASASEAAGAAAAAADTPPKPLVLVVAVVLLNSKGQVLLAQRPPGKKLAGLWEYPGGKVDPGESPEAALVRELQEELAIVVQPGALRPLTFASHAYESFHLLMPCYVCTEWEGQLTGAEGQALAWVGAEELEAGQYEMPPADVPLLPPVLAAMHQQRQQGRA